jgi:uncharacterized protein (TIGR03435 family)
MLPRKRVFAVTVWGAMVAILYSQTPEFEVVSLKPAAKPTMAIMTARQFHSRMDNAAFEESNASLLYLITIAYNINGARVSGPSWMNEQFYAIAAKLPTGSAKEQIPAMLQKVLADRFKLAVHHDRRVQQVYLLTVAKGGSKLKESTADIDPATQGCNGRPGRYRCRASTLALLSGNLTAMSRMYAAMPPTADSDGVETRNIDLPVVDQTGLTGVYDIDLQWVPPAGTGNGRGGRGGNLPPPDPDIKATSIFGAFEALGLKLRPGKHSFDILVVDHVERTPSEN